MQMRFGNNIFIIPREEFRPTKTNKQKDGAMRYALKEAVEEQELRGEMIQEMEDAESTDSGDDYPFAVNGRHDPGILTTTKRQFIQKLKNCHPLHMGFDIGSSTNNKYCYCPCGKDLEPWRRENPDVNMVINKSANINCNYYQPEGFRQHLQAREKDFILHYATMKYLEKLYDL